MMFVSSLAKKKIANQLFSLTFQFKLKKITCFLGEFLEKPAIKGLVDFIKPTIMNLIERQRLNYITNGTLFTKQKKIPGTTKTIFVRLSPNKKTICYGDWKNDNTIPDIDQLPGKMAIRYNIYTI